MGERVIVLVAQLILMDFGGMFRVMEGTMGIPVKIVEL